MKIEKEKFYSENNSTIDKRMYNLFTYADGWDLDELHENIREVIREHCIVFEGE